MPGFAFGDSTKTGDSKYVLAQFRHDAELTWVADVRSLLQVAELKWRDFLPRRHQVRAKPELSRRMQKGLEQAELTIIDLPKYQEETYLMLTELGAEHGADFDIIELNTATARKMIADSPVGKLLNLGVGTPAMQRLIRQAERFGATEQLSHYITITEVHNRAGGKLRDAVVLAARAHSMLSPSETMEVKRAFTTGSPMMLATGLDVVRSMGRAFDIEHQKSLPVLNDLIDRIASATNTPRGLQIGGREMQVTEEASHLTDHMQAADVAAGWAADLLDATNGDYRALARQFRWVGVNGIAIPG